MALKPLLQPTSEISHLDIHFSQLMSRLAPNDGPIVALAAALVSSRTRAGHICLDLSDLQDDTFLRDALGSMLDSFEPLPANQDIRTQLQQSEVVGSPGEFKPLILDAADRLYLQRYWAYQDELASFIREQAVKTTPVNDAATVRDALARYFPDSAGEERPNWQQIAAATALLKRVVIISGGPGTGKTYTVAKILALLIEAADPKELRIALAAPTGKAAVRLQESIKQVKASLACSEAIRGQIPEQAKTLHRLLGTIRDSPYFRHNQNNKLELDLLVVDEASMVDLALMSKLIQALPGQAKLILLGDHNQLSSVEAGSVLGDICDSGTDHARTTHFLRQLSEIVPDATNLLSGGPGKGLQDCIVYLKKSYRFKSEQGISKLSAAANNGDGQEALSYLQDPDLPEVEWHDATTEKLADRLAEAFSNYEFDEAGRCFRQFERFRILCAVRGGPDGVDRINEQIEQAVKGKHKWQEDQGWYAGQPLLITQNDYRLGLFNGDLGIVLPDESNDGMLRVFFQTEEQDFRKIAPFRLPEYEAAYAMTVHKSQGSEFEHVLLLLPAQDSPVVTRELIYTALTRAARKVEVWGVEDAFIQAVNRKIRRTSGLRDAVWQRRVDEPVSIQIDKQKFHRRKTDNKD